MGSKQWLACSSQVFEWISLRNFDGREKYAGSNFHWHENKMAIKQVILTLHLIIKTVYIMLYRGCHISHWIVLQVIFDPDQIEGYP